MLLGCLLFWGASAYAQTITFDAESVDVGIVPKAAGMTHQFTFTNTGDAPLTITKLESINENVLATAPNKPITPGEKSMIEVTYIGANLGSFYATLTVLSNAKNGVIMLKIQGNVM